MNLKLTALAALPLAPGQAMAEDFRVDCVTDQYIVCRDDETTCRVPVRGSAIVVVPALQRCEDHMAEKEVRSPISRRGSAVEQGTASPDWAADPASLPDGELKTVGSI